MVMATRTTPIINSLDMVRITRTKGTVGIISLVALALALEVAWALEVA